MADFLTSLGNSISNILGNSNFIQRNIGMANSYEDIMFIVQALGHEPVSLLGKDYLYIFDHVRRNYNIGTNDMNDAHNDCPKFTFYKEKPTVRFANPYDDPKNLLDRWTPDATFESTSKDKILYSYAESTGGIGKNKEIGDTYDIEYANPGVNFGGIASFKNVLSTCDILRKTNDNFNNGKYETLVARFHGKGGTFKNDITQTAVTRKYGESHGRNLLSFTEGSSKGYDNPYCRVWTYHHQYNQLGRAIRPFSEADSQEALESLEQSENYNTVGFRTIPNKEYGFDGASKRLDKYGVLNYENGMVNIAPTARVIDYFERKPDEKIAIKKCMFSIENLAWKTSDIRMDEYDPMGLSPEQKGPFGGRIMWFPPYDLSFSEDVRVNWNSNQFIGRGEKVYTYTDTERTGNLSFTLLIDHPSILDYWAGHDTPRGSLKNQGVPLKKGNDGGVDEKFNQENTLLRFFAGCEVLSAKPQEYWQRERIKDVLPDTKDTDPEVKAPTKKTIHCVLYFPNNYSGVDDAPNKTSEVNAIHYLMNGIGTQKYVNNEGNKCETLDLPTTLDKKFNGYEVEFTLTSIGKNLKPNYECIEKSYACPNKNNSVQYLTDENGIRYVSEIGGKNVYLAKIVGSKAMSLKDAKNPSNLNGKKHLWYRRRWYYRVDKAYENDKLSHVNSYLDTECYGLNSKTGYQKIKNHKDIATAFNINENTTLISFTDLFVALEGANTENLLNGSFDPQNVQIVRDIKDNPNKYKITDIKFEGHASYQGYEESNKTLSKNRAATFKKWMNDKGFPNISKSTAKVKKQSNKNNVDKGDNSKETVKLWRSASLIIEYESASIENAVTAEEVKADKSSNVNTVRTEIQNKDNSNEIVGKIAEGVKSWEEVFSEFERSAQQTWTAYGDMIARNNITPTSNQKDEKVNITPREIQGIVERYDNEGEFFDLLTKKDPFLHHLISEKIRYFDPAFHSISPEGFNARLTFLHQCTRQGSTVGGADYQTNNTAYNLAFGRPPVCVLRLGDFYYTKIIINSISIQYETPQWDLNPEGIGVMPMFAKVSLNFAFLGGSDLAGPISRLQNAVSFNYYANTSVYDNRAETVEYEPNGSGRESKFKPYSYPDMLHPKTAPTKLQGSFEDLDTKKETKLETNYRNT